MSFSWAAAWAWKAVFVSALCIAPPGVTGLTALAATVAAPGPAPLNIVGHVAVNGSVPLPGVLIRLAGPFDSATVTDANGAFAFRVPPGSYVISPNNDGEATFAPAAAALRDLTADAIVDFSCSGNCADGPSVVAAKELIITDPTVVGDARASSTVPGAPWSFRSLMERMAPVGTDPADFVAAWLGQFELANGAVNGTPVAVRNTAALRALWPAGADGKLDLARAPFRLLAITNRVDLHAAGAGEGRLVFGAVDASGAGRPMTVIFEYALPVADARTGAALTRGDWAARFHALGGLPFGPAYDAALQAVTDQFTARNASPGRAGGSAIAQVRSNEILMGGPWQLREFHLTSAGGVLGLRLAPTAQTPPESALAAGTPQNRALLRYLTDARAAIHGAFAAVPEAILGGQADESFSWTFPTPVDAGARHGFAGQTCNGCHFSEAGGLQLGGFYHVSPIADPGPDGSGRLSSFLKLVEMARRTFYIQNLLTCDGPTCAPGAEPGLL
jgi:hypothetical protein